MADSCPKIHHCSTDSPGWLNGTHPTVAEGIVQRKVCFLQHLNGTDCCYFSKNISVRNCGAFYVYHLDPPRCYSRYCGNGLPQAPGQNAFIRFFTRLMLLTNRARGPYWGILARGRGSTDRAQREKRTRANIPQYGPEQVRLVSSLLYGFLITFCFVFASP